jgi:hypothetical protein
MMRRDRRWQAIRLREPALARGDDEIEAISPVAYATGGANRQGVV